MIERNAILINGGSAADVDRASTAAAAAFGAGLSPPDDERAEVLARIERRSRRGSRDDAAGERRAADVRGSDALAAALLARGSGKRVAIIGFGGLGNIGVQIATATGASTTVINLWSSR